MKKLITNNLGGHPITLDDFQTVQDGYTDVLIAICKAFAQVADQSQLNVGGNPSFIVLEGCVVYNAFFGTFDITAGYVYYDGKIYRFEAATGLPASPFYVHFNIGQSVLNTAIYADGSTNNIYEENVMTPDVSAAAATYFDPIKTYRLEDVMASLKTFFGTTLTTLTNILIAWTTGALSTTSSAWSNVTTDPNSFIRYKKNGQTMHVNFGVYNSNITVSAASLLLDIPAFASAVDKAKTVAHGIGYVNDGSTTYMILVSTVANDSNLYIRKADGSSFATGSYPEFSGSITFELQ